MVVLEPIHEQDEDLGWFPAQMVTVEHFETLGDIQRYRLTLRHGLVYQQTILGNEYADPDFETAMQAAASRVNKSGRYFETPEAAAEAVFAEYETAVQQVQSAPVQQSVKPSFGAFIKKHIKKIIITGIVLVVGGVCAAAGTDIYTALKTVFGGTTSVEKSESSDKASVISPADELPEAEEVK